MPCLIRVSIIYCILLNEKQGEDAFVKNVFSIISGKGKKPQTVSVELDMIRSTDGDKDVAAVLPFRYSDDFFKKSACSYDHRLCVLSLGLTMSAFAFKGEGDCHVRKAFSGMGFDGDSVTSRKFDKFKPINDSCAYAFALKKIAGTDEKLLCVVIRSHRYGGEWVSNAHVHGEKQKGYSEGFKSAADKVYSALKSYISEHELDKSKLKIWVTGFSRGGAISNNLGHLINSGLGVGKDNVFVYTFAAPNTVSDENWVFYDNIFNIISEMDIVPRVPPTTWGFCRYGTDLRLPCKSRRGDEVYENRLELMRRRFDGIMQTIGTPQSVYTTYDEQERVIDLLMDYVDDLIKSPEAYAEEGYQSFAMDYLSGKIYGSVVDLRSFTRFLLDGNREFADEFCLMLEQWDKSGAIQKAQRIGSLNLKLTSTLKKHISGDKAPALEIVALAIEIFARYAARLTADKVTKGGQDYYYEQLMRLVVDVYHLGENSPLLMQHWPEVYLAWLLSGDERTLYRTDAYHRSSVK